MAIPKKIARYEIIDELGRGAMGSVFRARDPAMDRTVAIKTILTAALASEQANEFRQRFYREARAAGALAHPGIVSVFDVGEDEGVPFLVMEFIDGQTLADAMKKGERSSLDRVCEIGQRIAEALGYAHSHGVVHRDIKPANILLTSREVYGEERPKITDFGVAKLTAGEATTSGQLLGTPAFMPPEQFTGATIDGRTDLFSLGVILYWMSTGEQPFPGETMTAVSYKIVHTEPVPPGKLNPAIPGPLQAVILKCLAKSPFDRYQTGEELAQALAELRAYARGGAMQTATPQATAAGGGSEDTMLPVSLRPKPVAAPVVEAPVQPPAVPIAPPPPAPIASPPPVPIAPPPPAPLPAQAVVPAEPTKPAKPAEPAKPPKAPKPPKAEKPPKAPKPAKKGGGLMIALIALVVVAAAATGGGYWFLHRSQPAPQQQAPAPVAVAPAAPIPAAAAPAQPASAAPETPAVSVPSTQGKPSASTKVPSSKNQKNASQAAQTAQSTAPPAPAPVIAAPPPPPVPAPASRAQSTALGFDPKKIDPKENARLKFDLGHAPPNLNFTVEMDGRTFYKGTAGNRADYDALYVPPGLHQFRVVVSAGSMEKMSNTTSFQFVAKKHMTLKVELKPWPNASVAGVPVLDAATQVIATLKADFSLFN
jgi:serine/threonine-protein kinase